MLIEASVLLSVTMVGLETTFALFCVLSAEMMILKSEAENTAEASRLVLPVLARLANWLSVSAIDVAEFVAAVVPMRPVVVVVAVGWVASPVAIVMLGEVAGMVTEPDGSEVTEFTGLNSV